MLRPRHPWSCVASGCCQFVGGTEDFDIYMGQCHEQPYDPAVVLVSDAGCEYEFGNQKEFADFLSGMSDLSGTDRSRLGLALTFVQCFFPTPVRVAMDRMARGEDLETSDPAR